ncbi:MAG: patatin-like phospholipase family protein, partial [Plesiomonas sp.]
MEKIKVGVALGAGAAKGWAHIGVLRALTDLGIEADIVVGTSIGAFVGAAYANNRLTELENWVKEFSYWDVLRLMDFE